MTSEVNLRRALETIRDLPDAEIENGPEIAEAALDAIDHLNSLSTSLDTSAADVVAKPAAYVVKLNYGSGQWSGDMLTDLLPSDDSQYKLVDRLYTGAQFDTSRAETAAANARADALERDLRDALAVAEPWHNAYETQLARADALADLLDSNVSLLGKQLADEGRAREAAEAKLAMAEQERGVAVDIATNKYEHDRVVAACIVWNTIVPDLVRAGRIKEDDEGYSAEDAIVAVRALLTEIEGESQ